ncbi:hypothetical protein M9Y10_012285 [Tritrichomonas musculus]|uniref:Uncharacterized protein n=1 Tax=Tritrichomonas musculus TaxID=1915356 RepID=A0ABR2IC40_9EUKA
MNSLPTLADEPILAKKQVELDLSSYIDQNFKDSSLDFIQYLNFFPNLEKLGGFINSLLSTSVNEIFTSVDQNLINRSLCALLFEISKIQNNIITDEYTPSSSNIELETIKDKLNDSLIRIQTLESKLTSKDVIIDQLTIDNNELQKNIAQLKAKILKKKEKIDDLKLNNRKKDINLDEQKISIINDNLTSQITSLPTDNNYDKLVDQIYSLSNTLKFNDFEYQKLLESKHYCLDICQRLLDLCEEYESRISMAEEDKAMLSQRISFISNENYSLKKIIEESNEDAIPNNLNNQIPDESNIQIDQIINRDQKLQNKIENLSNTIKNQRSFIDCLATYIDRLVIDGDNYIPLLYQTNQIIHDDSLRKIILESIESLRTKLCIDDSKNAQNTTNTQNEVEDQAEINKKINLRNQFFTRIFGSPENLQDYIDNYIAKNGEDNCEYAAVIALCAANINLGIKYKDIHSRLSDLYLKIPKEYQKGNLSTSIHNFLIDSNDVFDKISHINDSSSFFHFVSSDLKTTIDSFLTEISNFLSKLQENIYSLIRYNKNNLNDLPTTISNYINSIQTQTNELKIELNDYKDKYNSEYQTHISLQRYSNELSSKIKEKELQLTHLQDYIKDKENQLQEFKSSSKSIIKDKDLTIKHYENELLKSQRENETNSLLLKNTKKLYKSQIDNVIKIEREKKENEIKELKQLNSENEKVLMTKLESKRKKVKTLQNQINEITTLFEKKMKKKQEKVEIIINETTDQISIIEESFKHKEQEYQNEIEMLKRKLLEEIESNSSVKIIQVPSLPASQISSIEANNDTFVKQIFNILSDFPSCKLNMKMGNSFSIEIAQSKILKALQQLSIEYQNKTEVSKLNDENLDFSNTISAIKSPVVSVKRVVNTRELRQWEGWALELAAMMNIPTNSMPEIKTAIRDVVLSQKSKRFMLRNVQSLRIQKKLLLENDLYKLKISVKNTVDLKGIIFFYISASCIAKTVKKKI